MDIKKVFECFEKSPQVNSVTSCDEKQEIKWEGYLFDPTIRWHFTPPLRLELSIPVKNQEYVSKMKAEFGDRLQTPTKFTVFYDGSNYIISTKVQDIAKPCAGVLDVRDFLRNLLEKEFQVDKAAPNPLREHFYLLFLSDTAEEEIEKISKKLLPSQAVICKPKAEMNKRNETISRILVLCRNFLNQFYATSMISSHMEGKYRDLMKLHMNVQEKGKEYFKTPSHSFRRRRRIRRNLEESVIKHYEYVLDYNFCLNLVEEGKVSIAKLGETLGRSPLFPFRKVLNKLIEQNTEYRPLDVDIFNACLDYTKRLIERTFSWKLAFYGAFFGAMSALLITYAPDIINLLNSLIT